MRRVLLVVQSDPHAGHQLGLMLPGVTWQQKNETGEYEEYAPKPNVFQEWLTSIHERTLGYVKNVMKNDDVILINGGDITHGIKYPQQLVTTSIANQILIAKNNLRPWLELEGAAAMRLVVGTASHNFAESAAEVLVADSLKQEFKGKNIRVLHHGLANINGVLIDYAHHGPHPGNRYWLSGNIARLYAKSIIMGEIARGNPIPEMIIRGHYHSFVHEVVTTYVGDIVKTTHMIVMPSMCGLSDHAQQMTQSSPFVACGMLVVEIVDGKILDVHPVIERIDNRTYEDL